MIKVKVGSYIDIELAKVNGQLEVLHGVLDDGIGWRFCWGDELPQNMFLRIIFSDLWPNFVREWQAKGLDLGDLKQLLLNYNEEQLKSALYVLTGDNARWHFGEPFRWLDEELTEGFTNDLEEKYGLGFSRAREVVDKSKFWWEIPPEWSSFDFYYKKYKSSWEEAYRKAVEKASSFEELEDNLCQLKKELAGEWIDEEYKENVMGLWADYLDSSEGKEEMEKLIEEVRNERGET